MQTSELHTQWEEICNRVSSFPEINKSQFSALLSRLQPQAIGEGFLLLTTENSFMKTWAENNFSGAILRAAEELYSVPFTLSIEVDTSSQDSPLQTAPSSPSVSASNNQTHNVETAEADQKFKVPSFIAENNETNPTVQEVTPQPLEHNNANNSFLSGFTFENFVIGDSNRLAYSMAINVAEAPGVNKTLNPLFIYGKSGLGKTHLMRAIQNYINKTRPDIVTVYVDAEELLSDYTDAAALHDKEKSSYKNFKTRYEMADVLLVDDVQYFQGKIQTLHIVFQIFNKLVDQGKQIILSADRAPNNIDIEERYSSRFMSGGTVDIQPPEIETKIAIIKSYVNEFKTVPGNENLFIPQDVLMYMAERSSSNIRELKGAVTKIIFYMNSNNVTSISYEDISKLLEDHFTGMLTKNLTIDDILKQIEDYYKVKHSDLIGKNREKPILYPRQIAMYLCRQLLDVPFATIGAKFNKDHTTIMHSVNKVESMLLNNRNLQEEVEILKKMIKEV